MTDGAEVASSWWSSASRDETVVSSYFGYRRHITLDECRQGFRGTGKRLKTNQII